MATLRYEFYGVIIAFVRRGVLLLVACIYNCVFVSKITGLTVRSVVIRLDFQTR